MYDERMRRFAQTDAGGPNLSRAVWATVVSATDESQAQDRPRTLYDLIENRARTPILQAITVGWSGRSWRHVGVRLQETTANVASGSTYSTDAATRMRQMADGREPPEGWNGDQCLVLFVGRQAVIVGTYRQSYADGDVEHTEWTDPASANFMAPGTTLPESNYVAGTDELPAIRGNAYPDADTTRWGRLIVTRWQDYGVALEVRGVDPSASPETVLAEALVHLEASETAVRARASTFRLDVGAFDAAEPPAWQSSNELDIVDGSGAVATVELAQVDLGDGQKGLKVSGDDVPVGDLSADYTPVVRYNQLRLVVDKQAAQISELQATINQLVAAFNAQLTDTKKLKLAAAAIVSPAGITNAVGAVPLTATPQTGVSSPAPTSTELDAMRSKTVKAGV